MTYQKPKEEKEDSEVQEPKVYTSYYIDRKITVWERETITTTLDAKEMDEYLKIGLPMPMIERHIFRKGEILTSDFEIFTDEWDEVLVEDNYFEATIKVYKVDDGSISDEIYNIENRTDENIERLEEDIEVLNMELQDPMKNIFLNNKPLSDFVSA